MNESLSLIDRVPAQVPDRGPSWLVGLRRAAASQLRESGFPTTTTEAWRTTPVRSLVSVPFETDAQAVSGDWKSWLLGELGDEGAHRIVLVNGQPQLEAGGGAPEGVEITGLAEALAADRSELSGHLGRYVRSEHFAALNAALFSDGLLVQIAPGAAVERPIHLVHLASPGAAPTAAYPRILVLAGESSQVTLFETYLARDGEKHLTNAVTEIALANGAVIDHVRAVRGGRAEFHVASLAAHLSRDASYRSHVATFGGALSRVDLTVALAGEGAECSLDGVYHVAGAEHVDHHTVIDHQVPHCTSREEYRGLVDERGHAVFDGTIVVQRDAQKSAASQENHNLLLSDDATINTKPHLEIDADDVSCSHGATIGALDEGQLFYLRSRGIGNEQAEAMLTYSFVTAILDRIAHEPMRRHLGHVLLAELPHGDSVEGVL